MFTPESDLLSKLKLMERLKAQLVTGTGQVFEALADYGEKSLLDALANLAITVYVLAKRLGIDFASLEADMITKLRQSGKRDSQIEKLFGDYSQLERYLKQKR